VRHCARLPLTEPVLDSDNRLRSEAFKKSLSSELARIRDKDVNITFSSLSAISSEHVMTYEKNPRTLREMIKSRVYQTLSPADFVMDYRITGVFRNKSPEGTGTVKCSVIAFMIPRALAEESRACLTAMGKNPAVLSVAQNNVFNFARRFLSQKTVIIAHIDSRGAAAHLIDLPDSIITRTAKADVGSETGLLGLLGGQESGLAPALTSLVSKLAQYHSIKYPKRKLDAIYLMGDEANESLKEALVQANLAPVSLVDEACFPLTAPEYKVRGLIYSVGALLGNEE